MSPASDKLFNTWFPAIVGGLIIGLLAAALWDILRRKTWLFASRFWPGVLKEVGLDHPSLSRTRVEEKQREVTEMLSAISSQISSTLVAGKSSMSEATDPTAAESSSSCNSSVFQNSSATDDFDIEAQTGINPLYTATLKPITFTATAYFPDDTPIVFVHRTKLLFRRYARRTVKRWKSSVILQAALPVDPWVLAEIGELVKDCMYVENRCTFQLGNWAILYFHAGEVHLRVLTEGDVPVNVEARWQEDGTDITMCGLYLNGAQVKVATKRSSTTLRSTGPAAQGSGDLDELHLPTEGLDVPGEDPLIYAAKVVEANGMSLIVRSEASFILPPREKSLIEIMWGRMQRISLSAKKMIRSLIKVEDRQPETTSSGPDVKSEIAHFELLAEHWKGVLEIELLNSRKEVLYYLQKLPASGVVECASLQPSHFLTRIFIRDQYHLEYWQRGLQDLNELILLANCPQNKKGLQPGAHISIRGGIKFLLGDFEGALQDFDLAYLITGGHRSTVLLERSLVKCMLARYSDAMQDILAVIAINPNLNDIQELHTCLQQILYQLPFLTSDMPSRPQLSDQHNSVLIIPDLLTGDEWYDGESVPICTVFDDITGGHSTVDLSSINSSSSFGGPFSQVSQSSRENGNVLKISSTVGLSVDLQPRSWNQCILKRSQMWKEILTTKMEKTDLPQHNNSINTSVSVPFVLNELEPFVLNEHTSLDILTRIAEGMAFMHSRDLLHHDLKLANVLLSYRHTDSIIHTSYVTDFDYTILGLGQKSDESQESDESPTTGTVEVTYKKADVFSFGMACYQILTGTVPFEDLRYCDNIGVYERVLSGLRPTLPSDLLNSDLKILIEKCWHDDPQQRPNFSYILEELRRIKMNVGAISD